MRHDPDDLGFQREWARTVPRAIGDDLGVAGIGERRVQLVLIHCTAHASGVAWEIRAEGDCWHLFRSTVVDEGENPRLLGYDELDAPDGLLAGFFGRLQKVSLLIGALDHDQGRDGTVAQLAWCWGPAEIRFRWWRGAAYRWKPIERIAEDMIRAFKDLPAKSV